MTNTVASNQWSLSQGNFRYLLSSSVMQIELLFTTALQPTTPVSSSTCSLLVYNLYEKHYHLKVCKFFCVIDRIQSVIDFIIISKD